MESRRLRDTLVVRADRGEELIAAVKDACTEHGVKVGTVTGIGACDYAVVGAYNVSTKSYSKHEYKGEMEILSFTGNISTMDGEYYGHFHTVIGKDDGSCIGGHANEIIISGTSEIFIQVVDGTLERTYDDHVGLNPIDFKKTEKPA